jgi:hypothetical protein
MEHLLLQTGCPSVERSGHSSRLSRTYLLTAFRHGDNNSRSFSLRNDLLKIPPSSFSFPSWKMERFGFTRWDNKYSIIGGSVLLGRSTEPERLKRNLKTPLSLFYLIFHA